MEFVLQLGDDGGAVYEVVEYLAAGYGFAFGREEGGNGAGVVAVELYSHFEVDHKNRGVRLTLPILDQFLPLPSVQFFIAPLRTNRQLPLILILHILIVNDGQLRVDIDDVVPPFLNFEIDVVFGQILKIVAFGHLRNHMLWAIIDQTNRAE